MKNKIIEQFLLHQFTTNEQDRERFNLFYLEIQVRLTPVSPVFDFDDEPHSLSFNQKEMSNYKQIAIIRTCLSRVNGEAVLGVFEGETDDVSDIIQNTLNELFICKWWDYGDFEEIRDIDDVKDQLVDIYSQQEYGKKTDLLQKSFSNPLDNGKPLDEAIQALHDKMLELVPEYQEFIKYKI